MILNRNYSSARSPDVEARTHELESIKFALDTAAIVVTTDARGVIVSVNDKFCAISGYSREELIGNTHAIVNSGFHDRSFFATLWQTISAGKSWEGEIRNRTKDGRFYWVHTTIVPLLDRSGKPQRYISIRFDITPRKLAEERLVEYAVRLEKSNRDLESFASIAAHDLQEPLRKILSFADRIVETEAKALSDRSRLYLSKLIDATTRMRGLVSDLLDLARLSTSSDETELVDLDAACRLALSDLEIKLEETGAHVEIAKLPTVRANRSQIHRLFLNLIGNALKFRREGVLPTIVVSAHFPNRDFVEILVGDNGIGIEERYFERIFRPFQRLHTRAEFEGSGMGLAVCQKIAERHGGSLSVTSVAGEGTVFHVSLALKSAP